MARSRNIKPSFFTNEYLAELSCEARLLFIGLWTIADRRGRLEDRPKGIKGKIFPFENYDVDELLQALAESEEKFILRYSVDGKKYIQIINFEKHQNPHKNEAESTIPAPCLHPTTLVQAPCNSGANTDKIGSAHADSLNPITDSLNPITDTTTSYEEEPEPAAEKPEIVNVPYQKIMDLYHDICKSYPRIKIIDGKRKDAIRARFRIYGGIEVFRTLFEKAEASAFLKGSNDRNWSADFDWIVTATNMSKVLEGKYDAKPGDSIRGAPQNQAYVYGAEYGGDRDGDSL